MERYLVRLSPSAEGSEKILASARSLARMVGAEVRNPKKTSKGSLEVDVFVPSKGDFELLLASFRPLFGIDFSHDLNVAPPHKEDEQLFEEARGYFNSERYWECHEVLEGIWRQRTGEERLYLQGLILVCAAYVHHQKGEDQVALSVLRRASLQLDFEAETYHGIDVNAVRRKVSAALDNGLFVPFQV